LIWSATAGNPLAGRTERSDEITGLRRQAGALAHADAPRPFPSVYDLPLLLQAPMMKSMLKEYTKLEVARRVVHLGFVLYLPDGGMRQVPKAEN
jgi:hypothetical protein